MSNKEFLEKKFIELNELKSMLVTYPEDYKENILHVMGRVCNQINSYLNDIGFHSEKRDKDLLQLTLEELSQYNGENGRPSYIAVNGTIYDIIDVDNWSEERFCGMKPGTDQTEAFENCSKEQLEALEKLRVVGHLNYTKKCTWE